jgi:hypothetical protein
MLRKLVTSLTLAAGVGFAGVMATSSTADARMFFFPGHHFFFPHHHFFFGPRIVFRGDFDDCHWLLVRAEETGSRFWWARFNACRFHNF